jgi:hypothetical protein
MVSDLLIHSRGETPNYLAVEMKLKGNSKKVWEDIRRLESLVKPRPDNPENDCVYGTLVGAFITYSLDGAIIQLFEDSETYEKKARIIRYDYRTDRVIEE